MERIWFIHTKGRQEGPLSLEELKEQVDRGQVVRADFCWREGMAEWAPIATVEELSSFFPNPDADAASRVTVSGRARTTPSEELSAIISIGDQERREHSDLIDSLVMDSAKVEARTAQSLETRHLPAEQRLAEATYTAPVKPKFSKLSSKAGVWLLAAGVVAIAIGGVFSSGLLKHFGNSFATIPEISADENTILAFSGNSDVDRDGYRISFVLSQQEGPKLRLYVSGNFPDGEIIHVEAKGSLPTLLGSGTKIPKTLFTWEGPMQKRLYQQELSLQSTSGGLYPGEYEFTIESRRLAVRTKKVFVVLAGMAQDAYGSQLRAYQAELRKKAEKELLSIKQALQIMSDARQKADAAYVAGKGKPKTAVARKAAWPKLDSEIAENQKTLTDLFQAGVAEDTLLKRDWTQAKYLGQQFAHVIDLYDSIVLKGSDATAFEKGVQESETVLDREGKTLLEKMNKLQARIAEGGYPLEENP